MSNANPPRGTGAFHLRFQNILLLAMVICRVRSVGVGVPKHFLDHAFQVRKMFTIFKIG